MHQSYYNTPCLNANAGNAPENILGGYVIKWLGLKRVFIPLALMISLPNLLYF